MSRRKTPVFIVTDEKSERIARRILAKFANMRYPPNAFGRTLGETLFPPPLVKNHVRIEMRTHLPRGVARRLNLRTRKETANNNRKRRVASEAGSRRIMTTLIVEGEVQEQEIEELWRAIHDAFDKSEKKTHQRPTTKSGINGGPKEYPAVHEPGTKYEPTKSKGKLSALDEDSIKVWTGNLTHFGIYTRALFNRDKRRRSHRKGPELKFQPYLKRLLKSFEFPKQYFTDQFIDPPKKASDVDSWDDIDTAISDLESDYVEYKRDSLLRKTYPVKIR